MGDLIPTVSQIYRNIKILFMNLALQILVEFVRYFPVHSREYFNISFYSFGCSKVMVTFAFSLNLKVKFLADYYTYLCAYFSLC